MLIQFLYGGPEGSLHESTEVRRYQDHRVSWGGLQAWGRDGPRKRSCVLWYRAGRAGSFKLFELRRCHQKLQMPELEVQDLVFSLLGFSLALVWPFFVMPTFLHFGTFHCMPPFMLQGLMAKRLSIRSNASLILLYSVTTTEDFWDQIKFILLYGPTMGLMEAPAPFMPITQDRQGQRW